MASRERERPEMRGFSQLTESRLDLKILETTA